MEGPAISHATPRAPDRGRVVPAAAPSGPFAATAPSLLAALAFGLATLAWLAVGDVLGGGRWLAVHLFTLGVVTNLVVVFSDHFGETLTRAPAVSRRWVPLALNAGVVVLLVGLPTGSRPAVVTGATVVTGVVLANWWGLREMRRVSLGARFGWIVRVYERAHGAFVHGAMLGLLLGLGVLPGAWIASARLAHVHVNLLGWAGATVLATLVFFGPTLLRTRIVDGAEGRASAWLRHGMTGLSAGVIALLLTGFGGVTGTAIRLVATAGLGLFALSTTVVCGDVLRAARSAPVTPHRPSVVTVASWFPLVVWADVVVVAAGAWRFLDALGLALLLGVLVPAISATLGHLAPMLRRLDADGRRRLQDRLAATAPARAAVANAAVVALVVVAAARPVDLGGALVSRTAWVLLAATLLHLLWATTRRLPSPTT